MDMWSQSLGYASPGGYPMAPVLVEQSGPAPTNNAPVPDLVAGNTIGLSTNFAVAGWLAAIIIFGAAWRFILDKDDD